MLTRKQVFEIIDKEREYQDSRYDPDARTSSGLTRRQRDQDVTADILMLEEYAARARRAWVEDRTGSSFPALRELGKLAAVAARTLERAAGSERLLVDGLRGAHLDSGPALFDPKTLP